MIIDQKWAEDFAQEWISAWNAHDLDRILSHYTENFEMSSPQIVERMKEASGTLKGKVAMREYWGIGLDARPPLKFELLGVHVGIDSIAILYRSIGRRFVIELLTLNDYREIIRGSALYGGAAQVYLGDRFSCPLQKQVDEYHARVYAILADWLDEGDWLVETAAALQGAIYHC